MKQSKTINAFIFILLASITTQSIQAMNNDSDSELKPLFIIATAVITLGVGIGFGRFLSKISRGSYCDGVRYAGGLIKRIDLSGSSPIICKDVMLADNCEIYASGRGNISIYLINQCLINKIKVLSEGSGNIYIHGENVLCKEQNITIEGSCNYIANNLNAEITYVDISVVSKVEINTNKLYVKCFGLSTITCAKKPLVIDIKRSGSLKLKYLKE